MYFNNSRNRISFWRIIICILFIIYILLLREAFAWWTKQLFLAFLNSLYSSFSILYVPIYIEIVLQEIFLGLLPSVLRHHLQMVSMWNIIIGAIIIRIIIQRDFGREKKKKAFYKNYFSALRFILLYINIIFILLLYCIILIYGEVVRDTAESRHGPPLGDSLSCLIQI